MARAGPRRRRRGRVATIQAQPVVAKVKRRQGLRPRGVAGAEAPRGAAALLRHRAAAAGPTPEFGRRRSPPERVRAPRAAWSRAPRWRNERGSRLAAPTYAPGNGTPFPARPRAPSNANGFLESDLALCERWLVAACFGGVSALGLWAEGGVRKMLVSYRPLANSCRRPRVEPPVHYERLATKITLTSPPRIRGLAATPPHRCCIWAKAQNRRVGFTRGDRGARARSNTSVEPRHRPPGEPGG